MELPPLESHGRQQCREEDDGAAGSLACTAQSASGKLLRQTVRALQTKVSSTDIIHLMSHFLPKEDLNGLFYKKLARGSATYDENSGAIVELTDEKHNVVRAAYAGLFRNLNGLKVLTPEEELHGPTMQKAGATVYFLLFPDFARLRSVSFRQCLRSRSAPG